MSIAVGTSSWTDPTLVRDTGFYPPGTSSAEDRLRYYSSIFSVVEVDSTYYAPPTPAVTQAWKERTPADFKMEIKAFGLFTGHPVRRETLWKDLRDEVLPEFAGKPNVYDKHLAPDVLDEMWARFEHSLRPLHQAGKLGAVMFQWPPWFTAKRANREVLASLRSRLPRDEIGIEFRHGSWMTGDDEERTLQLLADHGLTYVVVDEPQGFKTSVPPVVVSTNPALALVRFHGHNRENWQRRGISAAERFRYLYSEDELESWVPPLRDLDRDAKETHVLMNNCYQDYGVRNAYQLGRLLGQGIQGDAPTSTLEEEGAR